MIEIQVNPGQKKIKVPKGSLLLDILKKMGINITMPCGGNGSCGKCKVKVSLSPDKNNLVNSNEKKWLSEKEIKEGFRLSCQCRLWQDSVIFIPPSTLLKKIDMDTKEKVSLHLFDNQFKPIISIQKHFLRIKPPTLKDQRSDWTRVKDELNRVSRPGNRDWDIPPYLLSTIPNLLRENDFCITMAIYENSIIAIEAGNTSKESYGVAFDIGTTTIAGYLVNLSTYETIASEACNNPQFIYGYDVISRIDYVKKDIAHKKKVQAELINSLNNLIGLLLLKVGVRRSSIYFTVIVGNTTMHHFLWSLPTDNLGLSPYIPVITDSIFGNARDLDSLILNPYAKVYCAPNVSAYIGGDIVADLIEVVLWEKKGNILIVDLGTNGEIVLYNGGKILACSAAAGPAFEGAKISSGMRSVKGAIDKIMVTEKKIEYRVVGQTKARGICGSGVIDLISGLLKLQIIKPDGRLIDKEECPEGISQEIKRRIIKEKIGNKFLIISSEESATGKPIYLTQKDIREVQLAKGAISAGINVLLKYTHLEPKDLDEILLAGSFGNVLDINSALIIGLIPEICSKKILSIGNAAGRGATKLLLSKDMRDIAENLSRKIQYVELSAQSDFSRFFFDSMLFSPIDLN